MVKSERELGRVSPPKRRINGKQKVNGLEQPMKKMRKEGTGFCRPGSSSDAAPSGEVSGEAGFIRLIPQGR